MGNICKMKIQEDCVSTESDRQHQKVDQNPQRIGKDLQFPSPTRKQHHLEQFTYDLQSHLDSFDEEFYRKDYLYDNPMCPFQKNNSDLDFTFLEHEQIGNLISQATIRNKQQSPRKNNNKTQKSINYKLKTNYYQKKEQGQNSLKLSKKVSLRGILKNPSRSFDSIYARKKCVKFSSLCQMYVI